MSNRKLNKEGVGLGLSISKNIAQALGGNIVVHSQANKGSRFVLTVPMSREDVRSYLREKEFHSKVDEKYECNLATTEAN